MNNYIVVGNKYIETWGSYLLTPLHKVFYKKIQDLNFVVQNNDLENLSIADNHIYRFESDKFFKIVFKDWKVEPYGNDKFSKIFFFGAKTVELSAPEVRDFKIKNLLSE